MRMWRLQTQVFTLCIALSCVARAAGLIRVFGYEGKQAHVSCPYGKGYEYYEKYLCRNDCGNSDILISSPGTNVGKYSIYDDKEKQVVTVSISDLSRRDAGKYWCGVSRFGKDIYHEVMLEVKEDTCCDISTKVLSHEEDSVSLTCLYDVKHQNNLKYMCRGNQPSTCLQKALITSNSQQNGQIRLTDDKVLSTFTVTITSLNQNHSGWYLCGVQDSGLDVFSAVELEVKEWCCTESINVSGIVGHSMNLECPYPPQHRENRKFLCKGEYRSNCTNVLESQSRFTLQEPVSLSSFSVKITELKAGDAGIYWCGSDTQWSVGNYTKIQLSVVLQNISVTSTVNVEEPAGSQPAHMPDPVHLVVFTAPIVLLILTLALVIVYKYKCHRRQEVEVNMNTNKTVTAEAPEMRGADIYANQDIVAYSKQGTSKAGHTCNQYYNKDEDGSVYQNFTREDVYCNQAYVKTKR